MGSFPAKSQHRPRHRERQIATECAAHAAIGQHELSPRSRQIPFHPHLYLKERVALTRAGPTSVDDGTRGRDW